MEGEQLVDMFADQGLERASTYDCTFSTSPNGLDHRLQKSTMGNILEQKGECTKL
jgi:hypothetical protein